MFGYTFLLCGLILITAISNDFVCLTIDSQDITHALDGKNNIAEMAIRSLHQYAGVKMDVKMDNIDIQNKGQLKNVHLNQAAAGPSPATERKTWRNISDESGSHTPGLNSTRGPWGGLTLRASKENDADDISQRSLEDGELRHRALEINAKRRVKRGVVELYKMVRCGTGCDPLIYKGYGCYCGFLGSGRPVDGIDRCCKMHDICYDVANCPMYMEYVVPYYWKCYNGKSLCAIDHLDLGGSGSCAQRLCECDRLLSECLRRFPCPKNRAKCVSSPWRLLQNTLMFF